MVRKIVPIYVLVLLSHSYSFSAEIFVQTNTYNNKITIAREAKDYIAKNNLDYDLDFSVLSPLGNVTGARITYKPKAHISMGDKIVFRIYNAYISPGIYKCWLVFYEKNGLDTNGDGIGDNDFNLNNDYDTKDSYVIAESTEISRNIIVFDVLDYITVDTKPIPPNGLLYLMCADAKNNELTFYSERKSFTDPPATYDDRYNLVLNLKKSGSIVLRDSLSDEICIAVIEGYKCCWMDPYDDLKTDKVCFIDFKKQFILDMNPSISYINSYTDTDFPNCTKSKSGIISCFDNDSIPLRKFIDETTGYILTSSSCTDVLASSGTITIKNNPDNDIEDPIHLLPSGWKGILKVSLYDTKGVYRCDNSPNGYLALDLDRIFIDNNGSSNTNASGDPLNERGANDIPFLPGKECSSRVFVYEDGVPSSDTIIVPQVIGWTDDIYVGINGNRPLKSIKWGLSLYFDIYDNDNNLVYSYFLSESSDSVLQKFSDSCCYDKDLGGYFLYWKPAGTEAYIPYMLNSDRFRIIISNNSCWDAEIYARVWDEAGRVIDDVFLGIVKANSVKLLKGNYIFSKAKELLSDLGNGTTPLYSVILTVGAPKRDVEFAAYDFRNGKSKMIPVYDLGNTEWTYRNIDFHRDPFEQ